MADQVTAVHVLLGVAFGFFAGLFFAYALAVIAGESWPKDVGRVIAGWRTRR